MVDDLEAFCRREYPRLVGSLGLYTGSRLVGEELAQEALVRACSRWPQVRELDSPGAWVQRVGFNLANSLYRRRAAERRALTRSGMPNEASDDAETIVVRDAVSRLPQKQRAAIVLRYWVGLGGAETAAVLGTSVANVHQLCHRGLEALRRDLGVELRTPSGEEAVHGH